MTTLKNLSRNWIKQAFDSVSQSSTERGPISSMGLYYICHGSCQECGVSQANEMLRMLSRALKSFAENYGSHRKEKLQTKAD